MPSWYLAEPWMRTHPFRWVSLERLGATRFLRCTTSSRMTNCSRKWPAAAPDLAVSFGGVPGTVLFQGHTYAGVLQVNVRVPEAAPKGSAVPVVLTVNGASSSPSRTVAIQ